MFSFLFYFFKGQCISMEAPEYFGALFMVHTVHKGSEQRNGNPVI